MLAERVIEWTKEWERQGIEKGLEQGLEKGLATGLAKGLEKGRKEGEAALLLRLMELRFGPLDDAHRSRIQAADAETLLRWGERMLSADSLPDVFRD